MNLLLDPHAPLWFLEDDPKLTAAARAVVEDAGKECWVSMVSGWEMAVKSCLGKLRLPIPFAQLFPSRLETLGFSILPITSRHLHMVETLPLHHRDPFDRLLAAQALAEGLTVIGDDAAFDAYGVTRFW